MHWKTTTRNNGRGCETKMLKGDSETRAVDQAAAAKGQSVPPRGQGVQETEALGEEEFGVVRRQGLDGRASVASALHLRNPC